jgi:release factor glutamine methyltransferase
MDPTICQLKSKIITMLKPTSSTPQLDAMLLIGKVLKKSKSYIFIHPEELVSSNQEKNIRALAKRRAKGEPMAYLLGEKEFWSLSLKVNKSVLIPRPESELLVEIALKELNPNAKLKIADLGTGSGAIALALAKERPNWQIYAIEKSKAALKLARLNKKSLKIKNIRILGGDWWKSLPQQKYDAILSNPPYLAADEINLNTKFEPRNALVSANHGIADLKKIISFAPQYLKANGLLILEHGATQKKALQICMKNNSFAKIKSFHDLNRHWRVIIGITLVVTK